MRLLKFKPQHKEQVFFLPPSVEGFIPEKYLASLIEGMADELGFTTIVNTHSELGQKTTLHNYFKTMDIQLQYRYLFR